MGKYSSPYGHAPAASTSGTAVKYSLIAAAILCLDYYAAANLTLTGGSTTLDSATLVEGKLVGAFNQTTGTEDGVYVVDSVSGSTCNLVRAAGFAAGDTIADGTRFRIRSGTLYGGSIIEVGGTAPAVLGTDALSPTVVFSLWRTISLNLNSWREVTSAGDVGDTTANGGILASDTTPILRGDAAESFEISWATGNVDPISTSIMLPEDVDGSVACYLDLRLSSGTTDAASMVVETGWDGGALVSDTATDTATKSATPHNVITTIAAADVPATPSVLTIALTPPTHATNAIQLHGARLRYKSTGFQVYSGS